VGSENIVAVTEAFVELLAAVTARGMDLDLVGSGRMVVASDVPAGVAASYAVAEGMHHRLWAERYPGVRAELLPGVEFFSESGARAIADLWRARAAASGRQAWWLWNEEWWPLLAGSPGDLVAVHRVTGDVWFVFPDGRRRVVLEPTLEAYWHACASFVPYFDFSAATGRWVPVEGYGGPRGPWHVNFRHVEPAAWFRPGRSGAARDTRLG
jgi:hypothetical protein